ncbi:hypothetical protein ACIQWA_09875 [Kitasatospora sp. NPDC098652]|uniref:hypothetical protein n=1 Tax=Kitasatospora sp. NPDC098652 TaxID=3364095 RepID=UPI00381732EA
MATLVFHPVRVNWFHLRWSRWRQLHQARAEWSHYRRRGDLVRHPGYSMIRQNKIH